jgi:hypothetical protein
VAGAVDGARDDGAARVLGPLLGEASWDVVETLLHAVITRATTNNGIVDRMARSYGRLPCGGAALDQWRADILTKQE